MKGISGKLHNYFEFNELLSLTLSENELGDEGSTEVANIISNKVKLMKLCKSLIMI